MAGQLAAWALTQYTTVLAVGPTTPTPSPSPSTGFDWSRVHPDGSQIPKFDIFYTIMNATMFLGIVAAFCGLVAGAVAFAVGPIFGAHMISDRGKSMMWKAGLVAVVVGSATAIIAGLLVL